MRTTVRLDDDLLEQLKAQARKERVSVTRLMNRALKAGLQAGRARRVAAPAYREPVHAMGTPRLTLDKALALAASLEDDEIIREMAVRK
jgi:hypothetical protein